jgi:hypothetical protein
LRVEAAIARSGVLPYSDGTRERKEYRPPAEAFKADSMATAKGGPVTDLHPPKLVTPETFKAVSRGHACDDVRRDGDLLVVDLMVQDADLCALVESGERREVSCGYSCVVVPTPGVTPEGERYDTVQTQIVHNHVALLAPGTGRSGPEVSLRMDGAAVEVRLDGAGVSMKKTIKIRGVEFRLDATKVTAAASTRAPGAGPALARSHARSSSKNTRDTALSSDGSRATGSRSAHGSDSTHWRYGTAGSTRSHCRAAVSLIPDGPPCLLRVPGAPKPVDGGRRCG